MIMDANRGSLDKRCAFYRNPRHLHHKENTDSENNSRCDATSDDI